VEVRWTADRARIVTDVELEVAEAYKGAPAHTVVVTQPGGVVGPVGQLVEGVARFEPGEEVVAFLEAHGPRYALTGLAQGKFVVDRSRAGEPTAGQAPAVEALFLDPCTGQEVRWAPLTLPLATLKAKVRAPAATDR
jgi:hypothetical protein